MIIRHHGSHGMFQFSLSDHGDRNRVHQNNGRRIFPEVRDHIFFIQNNHDVSSSLFVKILYITAVYLFNDKNIADQFINGLIRFPFQQHLPVNNDAQTLGIMTLNIVLDGIKIRVSNVATGSA